MLRQNHTVKLIKKSGILLNVFGFFVLSAVFSVDVLAQDDACNADIWEAMNAKASLERDYQVHMNQVTISKPDSVFEFGCFDHFLLQTKEWDQDKMKQVASGNLEPDEIFGGNGVSEILSENPAWGGSPPAYKEHSLDKILAINILNPYFVWSNAYGVTPNKWDNAWIDFRASNIERNPCDVMDKVWSYAVCENFLELEQEGFFWYKQGSPPCMQELIGSSQEHSRWDMNIQIALQEKEGPYQNVMGTEFFGWYYDTGIGDQFEGINKSVYEAVKQRLLPTSSPGFSACVPPVRTGVQVLASGYALSGGADSGEFEDAICTNPGCNYNATAGKCE